MWRSCLLPGFGLGQGSWWGESYCHHHCSAQLSHAHRSRGNPPWPMHRQPATPPKLEGGQEESMYVVHILVAPSHSKGGLERTCASSAWKKNPFFTTPVVCACTGLSSGGLSLKPKKQALNAMAWWQLSAWPVLLVMAVSRPGSVYCPSLSAALPAFPCRSR